MKGKVTQHRSSVPLFFRAVFGVRMMMLMMIMDDACMMIIE